MIVVGLTGSIGMGKSVTARLFAEAGVPVHDADAAVHRLYEGEAVPLIEAAFPGTTRDGKVDRAALAARVLDDDAAVKRLEAVVVVSAPPGIQRARALERPGMTQAKLDAILARQMPDADKRARAHFVVDSAHGIDSARDQVRDILRVIRAAPPPSPLKESK